MSAGSRKENDGKPKDWRDAFLAPPKRKDGPEERENDTRGAPRPKGYDTDRYGHGRRGELCYQSVPHLFTHSKQGREVIEIPLQIMVGIKHTIPTVMVMVRTQSVVLPFRTDLTIAMGDAPPLRCLTHRQIPHQGKRVKIGKRESKLFQSLAKSHHSRPR